MTLIKTEAPGLMKDPYTGALLNTDRSALRSYKLRKHESLRVEKVEQDVAEIKSELEEIRSLLLQLVNR